MSRTAKALLIASATIAAAAGVAACGTEKIKLASSNANYQGAVLFSQRCSGCHTLSYAATHGSAAAVRTREITNGPNFDARCERPATRVLYAIENGGFSGGIMPQNIVVGQQAREVAMFVSTYAGSKAPKVPGVVPCASQSVGSLPVASTATTTTSTTSTTSSTTTTTTAKGKGGGKKGGKTGGKAGGKTGGKAKPGKKK